MANKIGIYDPYLDTLGGGERYCLTLAEILSNNNYQVDLFWSGDKDLLTKAEKRFGLNLSQINIVEDIFNIKAKNLDQSENQNDLLQKHLVSHPSKSFLSKIKSLIKKLKVTKAYDYLFILSDGSIPLVASKNNYLHVQVPFSKNLSFSQHLINKIKFIFIKNIICNSQFTQNITKSTYRAAKTSILYPPVDTKAFDPNTPKENIILSVGRFDNILNSKKQDILIEAFKKLSTQPNHHDWKLVLAGGSLTDVSKNSYLNHLQHISQGFPIEFMVNPSYPDLISLYNRSKIYWHAAGYQVDENIHPESTEHFGMSVVEAMAAGLVPLVVSKGGLPEIITDNQNGYLWSDTDTLISKTSLLIGSTEVFGELKKQAIESSRKFSTDNFKQELSKYFKL